VLLTGVIYLLLQVAFIGSLDPSDISQGWANLDLGEGAFGPLAAIATALGLGWLAVLLYIDAIVSPGDTGLIYTTVTARISYAMSRNGNAPKKLGTTSGNGVPLIGLILSFVIGLIAFLPFPSWAQLVGFVSSATVLSFANGPLVHAALRKQVPDTERPYRLPGGHVIPFLAFFGANLIIYWSGWDVVWKLMLSVLVGFVLLAVYAMAGGLRGQSLDLRSGLWTVPWLGGLTLLSWIGNYPEPALGNLDKLTFTTSLPLVFVLSTAIYLMAYYFRLPDEKARAYIEETAHEARVEEKELGATP
jgi:amino acid transporter